VKDSGGKVYSEGSLTATRLDLDVWMKTLPQPWSAAMEATMFTGWIYDHLKPHAAALKVALPLPSTVRPNLVLSSATICRTSRLRYRSVRRVRRITVEAC